MKFHSFQKVTSQKMTGAEQQRLRKPSAKMIDELVSFLGDFDIKMKLSDLPSFETIRDLETWRTHIIAKKLNS